MTPARSAEPEPGSRLRICHVITGLNLGGAEVLLAHTGNELARAHEVSVVYLKDIPTVADLFAPGVSLRRIPLGWGTVARLRAHFQSFRPDVVHTHLSHADFLGLRAARGTGAVCFSTVHLINFRRDWRDRVMHALYRDLYRRVAPACRVVCISRAVQRHVVGTLGVPAERAPVLVNAVPPLRGEIPSRAAARARLGIPPDACMILFVGRLEPPKAVSVLLEAFVRVAADRPHVRLDLVGDGTLRAELARQAAGTPVRERIHFHGGVPGATEYFAAADMLALPSVWESLGIVILEAFRAGLPPVASAIDGPAELIDDGRNGLLVPPRDPGALAHALARLVDDPGRRAMLAAAARQSFGDQYSIAAYTDGLVREYSAPGRAGAGPAMNPGASAGPWRRFVLPRMAEDSPLPVVRWRGDGATTEATSRARAASRWARRSLERVRTLVGGAALRAWLRRRARPIQVDQRTIVVLAPHPDDETFGCGGLIALKRAAGARVIIVVLTDGSASHAGHPVITPESIRAIRREESLAAAARLGVPAEHVHFLAAPDSRLGDVTAPEWMQTCTALADVIARWEPARIILPFRHDVHPDHEAVWPLAREAVVRAGHPVVMVEYPLWSLWYLRRTVSALGASLCLHRLDIAPVREAKRAAVACHVSQLRPSAPWTRGHLHPLFVRRNLAPIELFASAGGPLARI